MKYIIMMAGCSTMISFAVLVLWLESNYLRYPYRRAAIIIVGHVVVMVVVYSLMIFMEKML